MGKTIKKEKVEKQEKIKTTKNIKKEKEMSKIKSLKEAINETVSEIEEEVEAGQIEVEPAIEENLTNQIEDFSNQVFNDLKESIKAIKETGIDENELNYDLSKQSIKCLAKITDYLSEQHSDEKKEKDKSESESEIGEDLLNLQKAVGETRELINEMTKELTDGKKEQKEKTNSYKIGLAVIAGGVALGIGGYLLYKKFTSGENVELI